MAPKKKKGGGGGGAPKKIEIPSFDDRVRNLSDVDRRGGETKKVRESCRKEGSEFHTAAG